MLSFQVEGEWTQFFYELSFDEDAPRIFATAQFYQSYVEPVATCYEVTATAVLGGEPQVIGEGCIEASESADWGLQGKPFGSLESVLASCTEPPIEHFERWCSQFEGAADSDACGEACMAAQIRCAEGLDPEDDDLEDDPNLPDDELDGDSSDIDPPVDNSVESSEVSGCAQGGAPRNSGIPWASAGIFLLALGLRRRSLKA